MESPYAITVPSEATNRLDGVLLATFDTPAHYALLVWRHGLALAGHAALWALRRAGFAWYLLRTRLLCGIGGSLLLVTLPDERGAGPFYSWMGWTFSEEIVSRSGERYALYTRLLRA